MAATDGHQSRVNLVNSKADLNVVENEVPEMTAKNAVLEEDEAD